MKKEDDKYQSINHRINQSVRYYRIPSEVEKSAALNSILNKVRASETRNSHPVIFPLWLKTSVSIAAAVILAVILWVVLSPRNIGNNGNEVASLRLPDHSRVVLSPGSSISYPTYFWNRKLQLNGKAYFEVEKGSRFVVRTSEGKVEVLGTRFSVDEKNDRLQVICFEGKVKATFHHSNALLLAGSGVKFSDSEGMAKLTEKNSYPVFARFSANYSNADLGKVARDLEVFFGVQIENQISQKRFFSGSLNTGNLDAALSILTESLSLKFDHSGKNKIFIHP